MTKNKTKLKSTSPGSKAIVHIRRDCTLFTFMERVADRLKHQLQFGTARNYRAALSSFKRFKNNKDLCLNEIDSKVMEDYQAYLKSSGITSNSISFYMRIFRAVYNRAVEQGIIADKRPFRSVYTGIGKTSKRAIAPHEIKRIAELELNDYPGLKFARDIFLFLFYCRGMSFVDAAYLKKSDLKNGILSYQRRKTGQRLYIKVISQIRAIIDAYTIPDSPYLLPIITTPGDNERRQYETVLHKMNRDLKHISKKAGLTSNLTTYVSRHAWATIASSKNIPVKVISDALGHESISTTQIYLASIDSSEIDKANEIVVNDL